MTRSIFAPVLLVLLLAGCAIADTFKIVDEAGGDIADQAYALLGAYNLADDEALIFAQRPDTPRHVRDSLKRSRSVARPLAGLLAEAAKAYRAAEDRLEDVRDQAALDELAAVLAVLNERYADYRPKLQAFIDRVNAL